MLYYLLTIVSIPCVAQSRIYFQGTIGQYTMNSLKEFQMGLNSDINSSGIPTKIVTAFPISLQCDIGFDKILNNDYTLGGYANYAFTKGRMHYSDYSGAAYADQNVSRIVLGFKASKFISRGFAVYGKVGLNYSILKLNFVTTINGSGEQTDGTDFYSIGAIIEPGVSWTYPVKSLSFTANGGYELNIQGKTNFNSESYLLNNVGDKVLINWTGFRIGISLAYNFN